MSKLWLFKNHVFIKFIFVLAMICGAPVVAHALYVPETYSFQICFQGGFLTQPIEISVHGCDGVDYSSNYAILDDSCIEFYDLPVDASIILNDWTGMYPPFEYCASPTGEYGSGIASGRVEFYWPSNDEIFSGADYPQSGGTCSCNSGGGSSSNWCQNYCYPTEWENVNAYDNPSYGGGYYSANGGHYDMRDVVHYCNSSSRSCERETQFRCREGSFGIAYADDNGGLHGCLECPTGACCGVAVNEDGEPIDFDVSVAVAQSANSCAPYAMGISHPSIIIEDCMNNIDGWYLSVMAVGYVRTELPLWNDGVCKPVLGLEGGVPEGYGCKTDFRLVVKEDTGAVACADTEYRDYSTGESVCKACPTYTAGNTTVIGKVADNSSGVFNNRMVDCEITADQIFSDANGMFNYPNLCKMCVVDY